MRVLIIDDSLLAEYALKSYFIKLGHEVIGLARNAEDGKKKYLELKPDLITVDAVMPGISGQELIKYVNQNDNNTDRKTKILMISSDNIPEEERRELNVDRYIIKPVTMAKIRDTLLEI
ncbi:MAG: response regulator [Candidatus Kariarchaeaceae archaeon]|jgi:two-component system chemotaxis response regulator CheY